MRIVYENIGISYAKLNHKRNKASGNYWCWNVLLQKPLLVAWLVLVLARRTVTDKSGYRNKNDKFIESINFSFNASMYNTICTNSYICSISIYLYYSCLDNVFYILFVSYSILYELISSTKTSYKHIKLVPTNVSIESNRAYFHLRAFIC